MIFNNLQKFDKKLTFNFILIWGNDFTLYTDSNLTISLSSTFGTPYEH